MTQAAPPSSSISFRLLDAGHFATETHGQEIVEIIREFAAVRELL